MADASPARPKGWGLPRTRRAQWVLAFVLLLCNLGVAELIAWNHVPKPKPERLYCEHPRRFWTLQPAGWRKDQQFNGPVHINTLGLRGEEPDRTQDSLRVLLLGDSCIYGANVTSPDTLDRRLEHYLGEWTGRKVQVFNGGCPGYSTWQGLDLLRDVASSLRPDIVVIAYLYGDRGMDIAEDKKRLGGPLAAWARTWLWRSGIYQMLRHRFRSSDDDLTMCLSQGRGNVNRVSCADYEKNLRAIAGLCRTAGAHHLVFVRMPARDATASTTPEVSPSAAPDGTVRDEALAVNPVGGAFPPLRGNERDSYEHALADVATAEKGVLVNGLGLWNARPQRAACFWDDIHFNAAGCDAFARDLARIFIAQGFVSRKP